MHTGIKQKSAVQWAGVGMEDGSEVMVIEEPVLYFVVWSLVFGCWAGCVWSVVVGTVMRNWERERLLWRGVVEGHNYTLPWYTLTTGREQSSCL